MPKLTDNPKCRWLIPQFSMATMFVGITVICIVFGLVVRRAVKQRNAIASLQNLAVDVEVKVHYDYEVRTVDGSIELITEGECTPPGPEWLRERIGIDYFADVASAFFFMSRLRDDDLRYLRHFPKLKSLTVVECNGVTNAGLNHLARLASLTKLELSYNEITKLPREIGQLTDLSWLDVSANHLVELPREIASLQNLTHFNANFNQLTSLPPEIGNLGKLTLLTLAGNQLTTLPSEIGNLKTLGGLSLSGNRFSEVPPAIGRLSELKGLEMYDNRLIKLPREIQELKKLRRLNLSGNHLTDASLSNIKSLRNLTGLYLHNNMVTREGIADLERALPNCEITSDFDGIKYYKAGDELQLDTDDTLLSK